MKDTGDDVQAILAELAAGEGVVNDPDSPETEIQRIKQIVASLERTLLGNGSWESTASGTNDERTAGMDSGIILERYKRYLGFLERYLSIKIKEKLDKWKLEQYRLWDDKDRRKDG